MSAKGRSDVFFNIVHERNVGTLRKVLEVALPVAYGPDWYADVVKTPHDFTKLGASRVFWRIV